MAQDKLRERSEKSSLDHIASLAKTALTVGVGAALFYRGGGRQILSVGEDVSSRFLQEAKSQLSSRILGDTNIQGISRAYGSLISDEGSVLKTAIAETRRRPLQLRQDDRSLGGFVREYLNLRDGGRNHVRQMFYTEKIKIPTANEFVRRFGQGDARLEKEIEDYVFNVFRHAGDHTQILELARKRKLDQKLSQDQIIEIASSIDRRMKEESFGDFAAQKEHIIREAGERILDIDRLEKKYGSVANRTKNQRAIDLTLGDRAVTVRDMIENHERFISNEISIKKGGSRTDHTETIDALREVVSILERNDAQKAESFKDLYFDSTALRKRGGDFYSFSDAARTFDRAMVYSGQTLLGKIFKVRDFHEKTLAPAFKYFSAGTLDPQLAALTNKVDGAMSRTQSSYFRILDRVYQITDSGLSHVPEMDDTYLMSGRYGVGSKVLRNIHGDVDYRLASNKFLRGIDIGQGGTPTALDDFKSVIGKFSDEEWRGNVIKNLLSDSDAAYPEFEISSAMNLYPEKTVEKATRFASMGRDLVHFYSKNTYELTNDAVRRLIQTSTGRTKEHFSILALDDSELLRESLHLRDIERYHNEDLTSLLLKYAEDPQAALNMVSVKSSRSGFFGGTQDASFFNVLRTEVAKEGFMRHAKDMAKDTGVDFNFDAVRRLIADAGITGKDAVETNRLADFAAFQQSTRVFSRFSRHADQEKLVDFARDITSIFSDFADPDAVNVEFFEQFRENLRRMSSDKISAFEKSYDTFVDNTDLVRGNEYNDWIHMKKWVNPLQFLTNINDATKRRAFVNQFGAGRRNPKDITTATITPYFLLNRVQEALSPIGLNFSTVSTASTGDLAKNIMLKRVLPLMVGMHYSGYINDMIGEITGTEPTAAIASGFANLDLGIRRLTDATGLTEILKAEKEINPFLSYHTGEGFMSYEERKEWYRTGYSPVRKSRWWSFGSVSEWRGSKISYWEPNYLRRAHSDWKDKALYDSVWEKYSRSWLPTPTAPWSPLRYLMDPYWFENKHAESRPYPMTGKMFTEETPWGVILNPTIGELIKPQIRMHEDRLGDSFVDVKALIEQRNRQQIQKAKNKEAANLIRFRDGVIEPVLYTTLEAPTPSERVLQVQIGGGRVQSIAEPGNYQATSGAMSVQQYLNLRTSGDTGALHAGTGTGGGGGFVGGSSQQARGLSFEQQMEIRAKSGELLPSIAHQMFGHMRPKHQIEQINRSIMAKAQAVASGPAEAGVVTPESIRRPQARHNLHILQNREAMADLRGLSGGDDLIGELAYTARYMSGIYGYGAYRLFPGQTRNKLADAGFMTSPVRSFWDANIGGLGGGSMEVLRRFIPYRDRYTERINPLMNTMPDWMPDRFRVGDPYCVSENTLIETGKLGYTEAKKAKQNEDIVTHKGNSMPIKGVAIRKVKKDEKVYSLKATSLTGVEMKFSEEHPLLVVKNPEQRRRYNQFVKVKIYEQANAVVEALQKGVREKKQLAEAANTTTDDIYRIFELLFSDGKIYDYRIDKFNIFPANLSSYDLKILKNGLEWKKIKDVVPGDYIAYPKPNFDNKDLILDLSKYVDYPFTNKYIYVSGTMKKKSTMPVAFEWLEKNGVPKFKRGERKTLLSRHGFDNKDYENAQAFVRKGLVPERINRFIKITNNIAFLFGLYLAEGSILKNCVHMAHNIKEKSLFEKALKGAQEIHPSANGRFYRIGETNGASSHIYSTVTSRLLKSLFDAGAREKIIPDIFADLNKEILIDLIGGYLSGDGCSFNEKNTGYSSKAKYKISATSVNLKMLLQFRKLLLKYDVVASIQFHNKKDTVSHINGKSVKSGISWSLNLKGIQAVKLAKKLGYINYKYAGDQKSLHTFITDEYIYLRVIDIEEIENVKEVWGFEVGIDNSFCVAGVATHNTLLPKGEMRLPGRGYESLHALNPDAYGEYGAFDRMKILADIAPHSHEYRVWRDIAGRTVRDPLLREEMKKIRERVAEQSKRYDFHHYKFLGQGLDRQRAVIDEVINNNYFTVVGDKNIYRMAGITVGQGENDEPVLGSRLFGGMDVLIATDKNKYRGTNEDAQRSINAAIFLNGQNLNRQLVKEGLAERRYKDTSAAANMANFSDFQVARGKIFEALAHAPIPIFQQKYFKIRTPLESYKEEMVYGTPYASWTSPIQSFLLPQMERSLMSGTELTVGLGMMALNVAINNTNMSGAKKAANVALMLTNRGAMLGGLLGAVVNMKGGDLVQRGAHIGAALQLAAFAYTRKDDVVGGTLSFAALGGIVGGMLQKGELVKGFGGVKGAAVGALVGLAISASQSSIAGKGLSPTWIPQRTKEKWETQEYFDRLNYIKYSGFYEKASRKAFLLEGTNIKQLIRQHELDKEQRESLRQELLHNKSTIESAYAEGDQRREAMLDEINNKLKAIEESEMFLSVGKWGRTALIYKQAMDSTVYGLQEDASWAQILRSVPRNERDHFIEFAKERDPRKRKEILKYVSPYKRRILQVAWGEKVDNQESMSSFFADHKLPGPLWAGWRPNVDLTDVEVKTIYNEGMLISDLGHYESQLRDPNVINAPNLDPDTKQSALAMQANLFTSLRGLGLMGVDINVEPSSQSGIQVIADMTRIVRYNIEEALGNML